jgi:hypothetical protein
MKNKIILSILITSLTGCSFIKTLIAPFKNTVSKAPTETVVSGKQMKCKGEIKVEETGNIYCSDGFYLKEDNSSIKERKLTLKEKFLQFADKFWGYAILIAIFLVIVAPGTFITILNWIIGKQKKALVQIIQGVQDARKKQIDLNTALATATDADVKKTIIDIKTTNNI